MHQVCEPASGFATERERPKEIPLGLILGLSLGGIAVMGGIITAYFAFRGNEPNKQVFKNPVNIPPQNKQPDNQPPDDKPAVPELASAYCSRWWIHRGLSWSSKTYQPQGRQHQANGAYL